MPKKTIINWDKDIATLCHRQERVHPKNTKLTFLGDIALARGVSDKIEEHGVAHPLSATKSSLESSDYIVFNLECCLTTRGAPWEPKPVLMNGNPSHLGALPNVSGQFIANLANNHLLDYGEEGADDTIFSLKERGIEYFGVTNGGVLATYSIDTPEGSVALLGFSPSAHPLPVNSKINISTGDFSEIKREVKNAKEKNDITIVNLHQGVEYCPFVIGKARKLARSAVDAGADCVICHHTHVIQGIELYKGVVIFHGIGNFLLDTDFVKHPSARYSIAPHIYLKNKAIEAIKFQPFVITDALSVRNIEADELAEVKELLDFRSKFLSSPFRAMINDCFALAYRVIDRSFAMVDMVRRQGVVETCRYYVNRVTAS